MMQAQRSAPDALGVALCGIGAATVLASHESTTALLLLAGALYGMHRVVASRAALWAISAVVAIWFLAHFWGLAPVKRPYELMNEHPTLYATPGVIREIVWAALLVAIAVIGRPRAGNGLAVVTAFAVVTSALAGLALHAYDERDSSLAIVVNAIAKGWRTTAITLAAACFVAIAVAPAVEPLPRMPAGLALAQSGSALRAPMIVVLELGFLGVGVVAVSAPSLGLVRARGLVGVLALVAVSGSFVTLPRFATKHAAHADRPTSALTLYTYPVADVAMALWAACLACLVAPPRET